MHPTPLLPRRAALGAVLGRALGGLLGTAAVPARAAQPLAVLASFSILADLVRAIGGARVRVESLIGPEREAHGYQPRPSDARAAAAADVMVINGLGFEGWAERLASSAGFQGVPVVASRGVRALRAGDDGHGHGGELIGGQEGAGYDPHAWQDVANARVYVENILDGLSKADPAGASAYAAAAMAYARELEVLERDIRAAWASIPREQRRIVTSHEAFFYYGDAYGVDFLAPRGLAAQTEPTPRQLAALIRQIREQRVGTLFVETAANSRLLGQVASETGARIGPAVYADTLSGADGPAASYLAMMRHNTAAFTGALTGALR